MGKYFTDEEIDAVIKKWEETYPGAIERAHDVMQHPYRDNDEAIARSSREFSQVVFSMRLLADHSRQNPNFRLEINTDVFNFIGDLLGPISTRRIYDQIGGVK